MTVVWNSRFWNIFFSSATARVPQEWLMLIYCPQFPNLVTVSWLQRISGEIKANQKQQNIFEQIKINIWGKQSILFNLSYKAFQRLVVFLSSNQLMINWQHIPFPTRSWLSRCISHAVQSNTHEHYQPLPCQANYHSCRNKFKKTKMPARAWN